ncbi:MAG: AAA family ATPase [Deltaproteobacteria bacterium]|nr:AAA family ATPase [Deltaproteobacteria bacterium]
MLELKGQEAAGGWLAQIAAARPPGRVFLFWGPAGAGKGQAALALAAAWLCQNGPGREPCQSCPACRKFRAGSHPDLIWLRLEEDKKKISIGQARELKRWLNFPPAEGPTRVVLIPEAETLSLEAANSLLKTLEEPPADTLTVLTAVDPEALPATILSRCQKIFFKPLAQDIVAAELGQRLSSEPAQARLGAALAGDSLEAALELDLKTALDWRGQILEQLAGLGPAQAERLLDMAEQVAAKPEQAPLFLNLAAAWYRDLLFLASGGSAAGLANSDLAQKLTSLAGQAPAQSWAQRLEAVFEAQAGLAAWANLRLTVEALLLRLAPDRAGVQ